MVDKPDKPDKDAEATSLLCFSSPAGSSAPTVRICLGVSPPVADLGEAKVPSKCAFTVDLLNVAVTLPNPPSGQLVMGVVSISQSLRLSLQDMRAMHTWLGHVLAHEPGEPHGRG